MQHTVSRVIDKRKMINVKLWKQNHAIGKQIQVQQRLLTSLEQQAYVGYVIVIENENTIVFSAREVV